MQSLKQKFKGRQTWQYRHASPYSINIEKETPDWAGPLNYPWYPCFEHFQVGNQGQGVLQFTDRGMRREEAEALIELGGN